MKGNFCQGFYPAGPSFVARMEDWSFASRRVDWHFVAPGFSGPNFRTGHHPRLSLDAGSGSLNIDHCRPSFGAVPSAGRSSGSDGHSAGSIPFGCSGRLVPDSEDLGPGCPTIDRTVRRC